MQPHKPGPVALQNDSMRVSMVKQIDEKVKAA
jgi:hypothetical protein